MQVLNYVRSSGMLPSHKMPPHSIRKACVQNSGLDNITHCYLTEVTRLSTIAYTGVSM